MSQAPARKAGVQAAPINLTVALTSAPSAAARWETLFGVAAPQRLPRLIEQTVAWQEQMLLHGDVSPAIAHDLRLAVEHARAQRGLGTSESPPAASDEAVADVATCQDDYSTASAMTAARAPVSPARRGGRTAPLPPAASQLLPGSQLVKAYGGRNHVVAVEAGGFRYEGVLFASLSGIAKHITGTHWNGLLFFGLRKRRSYPPKPRKRG